MIIVTGRTLNITEIDKFIGFVGDNLVESRIFEISDVSLFDFSFKLDLHNSIGGSGIIDFITTFEGDKAYLTWDIESKDITAKGLLKAQLRAFVNVDDTIPVWHSEDVYFTVGSSINATESFPPILPSEFTTMEQNVTSMKNIAVASAGTATEQAGIAETNADISTNIRIEVIARHGDILIKALEVIADRIRAETAADGAELSASGAMQALADLLAMLGTDVATLVGGKVPIGQIPVVAIHDILQIASESELVTLTAQKGDIAVIVVDSKIVKSYQLLGDDSTILTNWVEFNSNYSTTSGYAETSGTAENSNMINGHRLVTMTQEQYDIAVKEAETVYLVGV